MVLLVDDHVPNRALVRAYLSTTYDLVAILPTLIRVQLLPCECQATTLVGGEGDSRGARDGPEDLLQDPDLFLGVVQLPLHPFVDRAREDFFDAEALDATAKLVAENAVAVADHEPGRRVLGERLDSLLGGPGRAGEFGDVEVKNAAAVVGQDEEDIQNPKRRSISTRLGLIKALGIASRMVRLTTIATPRSSRSRRSAVFITTIEGLRDPLRSRRIDGVASTGLHHDYQRAA
jgi:hypothetical protein